MTGKEFIQRNTYWPTCPHHSCKEIAKAIQAADQRQRSEATTDADAAYKAECARWRLPIEGDDRL